jgi:hypothetical protein
MLIGTCGCGDGDADTDDAAESVPTSVTATPTTTPGSTAGPRPPLTTPIKDTTPGDLVPSTPPEAAVTNPTTPTGSNVEIAVADLAARLDVDPSDIEIVSVEEVTWPDGSLGCPRPGMSYTQALVDGQRIVLAVGSSEYEYHSGRRGDVFYCPADQVTPPVPDPRT